MDSILEPRDAAKFADNVYILVETQLPEELLAALNLFYGTKMDISAENITSAKTGGPGFIKSTTAFGLMAFGKGAYEGHAFVILRGTKKTFPADWLTNFNLATSRSTLSLIHI